LTRSSQAKNNAGIAACRHNRHSHSRRGVALLSRQ